ncbi:hypothetical protein ACIBG8_03690 [Nonomuraea sp. NPDC050556]|uniref:hypothetical protein n=1 Tax=Nonomuraea sp. NPDC050556 TaxID=3364369 RepID=UPI0037B9C576
MNILELGSETRGRGSRTARQQRVETPRAETAILLYVAADRRGVTLAVLRGVDPAHAAAQRTG